MNYMLILKNTNQYLKINKITQDLYRCMLNLQRINIVFSVKIPFFFLRISFAKLVYLVSSRPLSINYL